MSFQVVTTPGYDESKFVSLGSVLINRVETISLLRSAIGGIAGIFGGKNSAIQTAIDNLTARSMADFTAQVQSKYPNTVKVVGVSMSIANIGRDENHTYNVMSISGTCLGPKGGAVGGKRKTMRRRNAGKTRRSRR